VAELEAALADTEERLRLITEGSRDILCFFHPDGVFAYVSRAFGDVLGYPPESVAGTHFRAYFDETEIASAAEIFARVAGGEEVPPLEVTARHRDGHPVPLEVSAAPVVRAGRTVGVYGIARDATLRRRADEGLRWYSGHLERLLAEGDDRVRRERESYAVRLRRHRDAEATLRESEALLRAAIETAPYGVALADLEGEVAWASRRFAALLGDAGGRVAGLRIADAIEPADRQAVEVACAEVAAGRSELRACLARLVGAPHSGRARLTFALVRHACGKPRRLVVAVEPVAPTS
jgi:PAS domain S-box-containing protein